MKTSQIDSAYLEARSLVREHDPTRYLALLFSPVDKRSALFSLYAFHSEISRVRDLISQPLPGEIRLQWWRDTIERSDGGGHPIATALLNTIDMYNLPKQAFYNMIEAYIFDLYDDLLPTWQDLIGYYGETHSALFRLASLIISDGENNQTTDICGSAGVAYGLTYHLAQTAHNTHKGKIYIPQEVLDMNTISSTQFLAEGNNEHLKKMFGYLRAKIWDQMAQAHAAANRARSFGFSTQLQSVFLPLAIIKPTLQKMTKNDHNPMLSDIKIANWQKIIAMIRFRL